MRRGALSSFAVPLTIEHIATASLKMTTKHSYCNKGSRCWAAVSYTRMRWREYEECQNRTTLVSRWGEWVPWNRLIVLQRSVSSNSHAVCRHLPVVHAGPVRPFGSDGFPQQS